MRHQLGRMRGWVVAAVVLLGVAVPAGFADASPVHVGILGGIGIARLQGPSSPVTTFTDVKSACYGVTMRFPIGRTFSLQPEALAVTDGISYGKFQQVDNSGNVLGTFESLHVLDRLQVPVLVRIEPPGHQRLRPFIFAGPYAATRLREYDRTTGSSASTRTNPILRSSDFGVTMGGGAQARLGPGQFELQARYDTGLSDLGDFRGLGRAHTGALRILAGYGF
jgi:hypothetical protein